MNRYKLQHILLVVFTIVYLIGGTLNFHYKWFPIEYIQAVWVLSLMIPLCICWTSGYDSSSSSKCTGNCNQGRTCNCKGK